MPPTFMLVPGAMCCRGWSSRERCEPARCMAKRRPVVILTCTCHHGGGGLARRREWPEDKEDRCVPMIWGRREKPPQ